MMPRLCACGCGHPTTLARQTERRRGSVKGMPQKFIVGHNIHNRPTRSAYRTVRAPEHPTSDSKGYVVEHILIAERALGRAMPKGSEVHHVDNNGLNNAPSNLVICQDRAYHKLLHQRAYVKQHGGDPNTQRICGKCRQPQPFAMFNKSRDRVNDGLTRTCKSCTKVIGRARDRVAELATKVDATFRPMVQELYDATTQLQAVLTFTVTSEDLLRPEMDYACRRVMAARSAIRRARLVSHLDAALLENPDLPAPFNVPAGSVAPKEEVVA